MYRIIYKVFLLCCVITFGFQACGDSADDGTPDSRLNGKQIFRQHCVLCHGVNGKLQLNGAMDLTASKLTKAERIEVVANGRNTMNPFEGILSEEEIEAVVDYTFTLSSEQ